MEVTKVTKSTEYLYGVSPCYFLKMDYITILKTQLRLARERLDILTAKLDPNLPPEKYNELQTNIADVKKAIEWNIYKIKEIEKCRSNNY